jgi:hypothetical protein
MRGRAENADHGGGGDAGPLLLSPDVSAWRRLGTGGATLKTGAGAEEGGRHLRHGRNPVPGPRRPGSTWTRQLYLADAAVEVSPAREGSRWTGELHLAGAGVKVYPAWPGCELQRRLQGLPSCGHDVICGASVEVCPARPGCELQRQRRGLLHPPQDLFPAAATGGGSPRANAAAKRPAPRSPCIPLL